MRDKEAEDTNRRGVPYRDTSDPVFTHMISTTGREVEVSEPNVRTGRNRKDAVEGDAVRRPYNGGGPVGDVGRASARGAAARGAAIRYDMTRLYPCIVLPASPLWETMWVYNFIAYRSAVSLATSLATRTPRIPIYIPCARSA